MKEVQKLLSTTRQALEQYQMIRDGDSVAVGLSGGKDSSVLLLALARLRSFYPHPFTLCGISVDMGFPGFEEAMEPLRAWCASLDVPFYIEKTGIARLVFEERQEKNPCSLCAKLRRGALNSRARELGAGTIALGHQMEDAVETMLMELLYTGRIGCFSPVTDYADTGLSVIRPLLYTRERDVRAVVRAEGIPIVPSLCPEDGHTEREEMKKMLRAFDEQHRGVYRRILGAMERHSLDGWHV